MRAIAIVVIVAYHAGIPGFSGGFIGVDVFFVLSGFLITQQLMRHADENGTVSFRTFWAKRIRRLVPGLALMVFGTLMMSIFIFSPFDLLEVVKQGASASVYVSNLLFAQNAQNYFGSNVNNSPFLHTWSLGVEEQFYLIWPFVIFIVTVLTKGRSRGFRLSLPWVLGVILVASFAINLRWTGEGSSWAFFSLPTRAWEFAAGGLVAAIGAVAWKSRTLRSVGALGGVLAIAFGTRFFTGSTTYPGWRAAVPVVAAMLLLFFGNPGTAPSTTPVTTALSLSPLQWIGRHSYSWYLWHWPFIVLAVLVFHSQSTSIRVIAALVSLPVAVVAYRYIENPVRRSSTLAGPSRKTYLLGAAVTIAILGVCAGMWKYAEAQTPQSFTARMGVAVKDFFPGCAFFTTPYGLKYCAGGDLKGTSTVALVGDSHASTWFNAMSPVAKKAGLRLVLYTEPGCPIIPVDVRPAPNGPIDTAQCLLLRQEGLQLLDFLKPKEVVLSQHDGYVGFIIGAHGQVPGVTQQVALWQAGFKAFLLSMKSKGYHPAVVLDNPTLPESPQACVSRTGSVSACEPTRRQAFSTGRLLHEAEVEALKEIKDVPSFAPDSVLCNSSGCPLEINGRLLYADDNHLLLGATSLMEPQLAALLAANGHAG